MAPVHVTTVIPHVSKYIKTQNFKYFLLLHFGGGIKILLEVGLF